MGKYYSYSNFDIDVNSSALPLIIWGIYIGIVLGALGSILFRVHSAKLVKALVKNSADSEEKSLTLAELGLGKGRLLKHYLKDDSVLRRSVLICGDCLKEEQAGGFRKFWYEKFLKTSIPQKTDFEKARFYLPEENRIAAELRFREEGHPLRDFIFAAVILFAVAVFAAYAIPELLLMFDNFLTTIKPESKFF
jgi:hypothetical protein